MVQHDQNQKMRMKGERLITGENPKGQKRRKMVGQFSVTWIIAKIDCAKFHPNGKN